MAKRSAKPSSIPPEQWDLPVSFGVDGAPVTLRQFVQGEQSALGLSQLSPEQRAELTMRRIEMQPTFEVAMIGGGLVDKQRAIAEVRARSDIGRVLIEIEQRLIQNLLEMAHPA